MFRAGNIPWNKGLKAETNEKVRLSNLKSAQTFKKRGYKTRLGIQHTEETKEKIRQFRLEFSKTHPAYWKGKSLPEETRRKIGNKKRNIKMSIKNRIAISKGLLKGGVTKPEKEYGFTRMIYKEWMQSIKERDKRLCQICLSDEIVIVAHHILPFKTHRNLRYDISNGVTLCKGCHIIIHNFSSLIKKAKNSGKLQLLSKLLKALDNPEPSLDSNILEGVTTNGESHKDNNSNTSLAADSKARDSLSQIIISGSNV